MTFFQSLSRPLLCLLLLSLLPAGAQEEGGANPDFTTRELEALANLPKIPERQKRLPGELAFALCSIGQDGEDFFYLRDGKPERVFFNTGVVRRFQFGGDETGLTLFKRAKNEEGEFEFKPVGRATPPNGSRDGIILFHPTEKKTTAEGSRKHPFIDLSTKSFSRNDIRMVNITSQPLVIELNEKPIKLPPCRKSSAVTATKEPSSRYASLHK